MPKPTHPLAFALTLAAFSSPIHAEPVDSAATLAAHNDWRAKDGVPAMSWSPKLEQQAEQWANHLKDELACRMKHSGPGENLYWASPKKSASKKDAAGNWIWENSLQAVTPADVVASWGSEKTWYDYATNSCNAPKGKACGHYTQVVWKNSVEVGCAKAVCGDFSQVWVCNYAPPGNYVGQKPF